MRIHQRLTYAVYVAASYFLGYVAGFVAPLELIERLQPTPTSSGSKFSPQEMFVILAVVGLVFAAIGAAPAKVSALVFAVRVRRLAYYLLPMSAGLLVAVGTVVVLFRTDAILTDPGVVGLTILLGGLSPWVTARVGLALGLVSAHARPGFCPSCGYDCRHADHGGVCPECGAPVKPVSGGVES